MLFKAILFDLDGTLLDTIEDLADSVNETLKANNFPLNTLESYKTFVGDGLIKLVERSIPEGNRTDDVVNKIAEEARKEYDKRWKNKTRPYNGIPELLNMLSKMEIKKVILSNKPDKYTQLIVSDILKRWKFDIVLGSTEDLPRKPNPAAALSMALELNIKPSEFIYLGDTNTDMQTAVSAGMYPVGALWGFRDKKELISNGARRVIKHPLEMLYLI